MAANIRYLRRASTILKVLALLSVVYAILKVVFILLPYSPLMLISTQGSEMSGVNIGQLVSSTAVTLAGIQIATEIGNGLVWLFILYTGGVVLEYITQLGEEVTILRRVQWEQVNGNKK